MSKTFCDSVKWGLEWPGLRVTVWIIPIYIVLVLLVGAAPIKFAMVSHTILCPLHVWPVRTYNISEYVHLTLINSNIGHARLPIQRCEQILNMLPMI